MWACDPYENEIRNEPQNCFQQALIIAEEHNVQVIYWVDEYEHYYVVVPESKWALGHTEFYPRLSADYVLAHGEQREITDNDRAIWLPKK